MLIAMVLCIAMTAEPIMAASSYEAGSDITFDADKLTNSSSGSGKQDTRTDEEKRRDENNRVVHNTITHLSKDIIEHIKRGATTIQSYKPVVIEKPGGYYYVYDSKLLRQELYEIAYEGLEFVKDAVYFQDIIVPTTINTITEPNVSFDAIGALGSVATRTEVTPGYTIPGYYIPEIWKPYNTVTKDLRKIWGGDWVRVDRDGSVTESQIPVFPPLIDFKTYTDRYAALKWFLDCYASQKVEVRYIVEYSISDAKERTMKTQKVVNWPNTNQTHFWDIRCKESADPNITVPALQVFSGSQLTQKFGYAGLYQVQATEQLETTYWDAMTYNKCEYLVIAKTGQIIWKNEVKGGTINTSKPLDEQSGLQKLNVKYRGSETSIYTVFDKEVLITNVSGKLPSSAWDDKFTTNRVE